MNKKKIIISTVTIILAIVAVFFRINYTEEDVNKISDAVETVSNIIENNVSSTEIPKLEKEDEEVLEIQETELESFKNQGDIAYNGSDKTPKIEVGKYQGLTYYSQADSRWANHKYSAINNKSQTIMSSGCGPTSAAMIVSSIKGTITPPEMGDLFVQNGYRSKNSGTYSSAFKWTADVFDIDYQQTISLDKAVSLLKNNNYIVAGCGEGLFTYGGHFIVLTGIAEDTIKIYDPYLYAGKFDVSSRRGKVIVKGNTVYITKNNFKKYANAQNFYCFKNDRVDKKENTTAVQTVQKVNSSVKSVNYKIKVTSRSGLNIRSGASTSYKIKGAYTKNTIVTITKQIGNWGKTSKGWICLDYTKKTTVSKSKTYIVSHRKRFKYPKWKGYSIQNKRNLLI